MNPLTEDVNDMVPVSKTDLAVGMLRLTLPPLALPLLLAPDELVELTIWLRLAQDRRRYQHLRIIQRH